ncbi:MAG: Crp/Fnr family transcriptional regulator [Bdellovibrionaceae bacterium]|nr:Crp/Fnr family transcriptional regulator [Pseudobdellovibrionaceae bacterium]
MTTEMKLPLSPLGKLEMILNVPRKKLLDLTKDYKFKVLKKGEILFKHGSEVNDLIIILKGNLRIVKLLDGREINLTLLNSGDIAGAILLNSSSQSFYPGDIQSINKSEIILIPKNVYHTCWINDPDIYAKIQNHIQKRITYLHEDKSSQIYSIEKKLAIFLLRHFSESLTKKDLAPIFTKREIASALGARTETIIRAMKIFEKKQLIKIERKEIILLDINKLKSLSV